MKVFISWSGKRSESVGERIRDWLPNVLQSVEPYFTPSDMDKGGVWATEISRELAKAKVGILCVTKENVNSPWILFEAGALSKQMDKSHVCPIVFDIKPTDLAGPLAQFQSVRFEHDDFLKLLSVINDRLEDRKIAEKNLNVIFEKFWPDLEQEINECLDTKSIDKETESPRSDRDLLEEILQLMRNPRAQTNISDIVVGEILKQYIKLHDGQASKVGDYQDTLNTLRDMHAPMSFLVKQSPRLMKTDAAQDFNRLSYKVQVQENPPDEFDDDIPWDMIRSCG